MPRPGVFGAEAMKRGGVGGDAPIVAPTRPRDAAPLDGRESVAEGGLQVFQGDAGVLSGESKRQLTRGGTQCDEPGARQPARERKKRPGDGALNG